MNFPATAPDFVEHGAPVDPRVGLHRVTVYFGSDDTARELIVTDLDAFKRALCDPASHPLIYDEDPEGANGGIRSCLVTDWQEGWDEPDVHTAEPSYQNTDWAVLPIMFVIATGMSVTAALMLNHWALGLGDWSTRAFATFLLINAGAVVGLGIAKFLR